MTLTRAMVIRVAHKNIFLSYVLPQRMMRFSQSLQSSRQRLFTCVLCILLCDFVVKLVSAQMQADLIFRGSVFIPCSLRFLRLGIQAQPSAFRPPAHFPFSLSALVSTTFLPTFFRLEVCGVGRLFL